MDIINNTSIKIKCGDYNLLKPYDISININDNCIDIIPNTINNIHFKQESNIKKYKSMNNLPKETETLIIKTSIFDEYNKLIDNLPISLIHLKLNNYNKTINNLPLNLLKLEILRNFSKKIDKIPNSILQLTLSDIFNNSINNLPTRLIKLEFHKQIDPFAVFYIGCNNMNFDFLPESLEILVLPEHYSKQINDLPSSIKTIYIYKHQHNIVNKMYSNKIKIINDNDPVFKPL